MCELHAGTRVWSCAHSLPAKLQLTPPSRPATQEVKCLLPGMLLCCRFRMQVKSWFCLRCVVAGAATASVYVWPTLTSVHIAWHPCDRLPTSTSSSTLAHVTSMQASPKQIITCTWSGSQAWLSKASALIASCLLTSHAGSTHHQVALWQQIALQSTLLTV
jgi:hypothetical protein